MSEVGSLDHLPSSRCLKFSQEPGSMGEVWLELALNLGCQLSSPFLFLDPGHWPCMWDTKPI